MTKTLTALSVALLTASTAFAGGVELRGVYQDSVQSADSVGMTVRPFVGYNGIEYGLKVESLRDVKSGDYVMYVEPQATKMYALTNSIQAGATVGLGMKTMQAYSNAYGTIEPKVTFSPSKSVTVGAGVRYRNDFEQYKMESLTYTGSVSYNVTNDLAVTVSGYEMTLDERNTGYAVAVTKQF